MSYLCRAVTVSLQQARGLVHPVLCVRDTRQLSILQDRRTAWQQAKSCQSPWLQTKSYQSPGLQRLPRLQSRELSVWGGVKEFRHTPLPALVLGVGGLVPFVAPPLYMMYYSGQYCTVLEQAHLTYGAIILSFIGGVRWGLTLAHPSQGPSWRNLVYSVSPSLIAWPALLVQPLIGYSLLTAGLLTAGVIDVSWAGYPLWFKTLRVLLTVCAVGSITVMVLLKTGVLQLDAALPSMSAVTEDVVIEEEAAPTLAEESGVAVEKE